MCHFWNVSTQSYETDGCETIAPAADSDESLLYCACTHLTNFAGIQVPTSADELEDELASVRVGTFSAQEAAQALA